MESRERAAFALPGALMFVVWLGLVALTGWAFSAERWGVGALGVLVVVLTLPGFFIVQPNQASVVTLFGRYVGSQRRNGWFWTNPFTSRKRVSLRIRNFNSERLKVNDAGGSPIEIAAVVVWRVVDSARAVFDVEDYTAFVSIQSETALRHLAAQYPYDEFTPSLHGENISEQAAQLTSGTPAPQRVTTSLRGDPEGVAAALAQELASRLTHAGVEVLEARLSHLAYAPEIAGAMLQRQQAAAVVAARSTIVAGAVGMVREALNMLNDQHIVELDEERKAQMVSNLLVVLTSERGTQPVLNTGSLY